MTYQSHVVNIRGGTEAACNLSMGIDVLVHRVSLAVVPVFRKLFLIKPASVLDQRPAPIRELLFLLPVLLFFMYKYLQLTGRKYLGFARHLKSQMRPLNRPQYSTLLVGP